MRLHRKSVGVDDPAYNIHLYNSTEQIKQSGVGSDSLPRKELASAARRQAAYMYMWTETLLPTLTSASNSWRVQRTAAAATAVI